MEILFTFLIPEIIKLKNIVQMELFLESFDYKFAGFSKCRPGGLTVDPNGDIYFVDAAKV